MQISLIMKTEQSFKSVLHYKYTIYISKKGGGWNTKVKLKNHVTEIMKLITKCVIATSRR